MARKKDNHVMAHRVCFSTESGREVLSYLLTEAGMFDDDLKTSEEIAVENFAKKILKNLGILDTPEKIQEYVNKLFELRLS